MGHLQPAAPLVRQRLRRAYIFGSHRTLTQDVSFGIDQLTEIAIRALSPAVNDTFTALTCIDWLSECLCKIVAGWRPARVHRDEHGYIRVISAETGYDRLVQRAFEKIRQASLGMPAVMIRQLEALARIMAETMNDRQRRVLLEQAAMIDRASERSVPEADDRADVRRRYEAVLAMETRLAGTNRTSAMMASATEEILPNEPWLTACRPGRRWQASPRPSHPRRRYPARPAPA